MSSNIIAIIIITVFSLFSCHNDKNVQQHISSDSTLAEKKQHTQIYQQGQKIFKKYCGDCHHKNMVYEMVSPPLGYSLQNRDSAWIRYKIREGSYAREDGDSISLANEALGWGFMPSYEILTDEQVDKLLYFVQARFDESIHQRIMDTIRFETQKSDGLFQFRGHEKCSCYYYEQDNTNPKVYTEAQLKHLEAIEIIPVEENGKTYFTSTHTYTPIKGMQRLTTSNWPRPIPHNKKSPKHTV